MTSSGRWATRVRTYPRTTAAVCIGSTLLVIVVGLVTWRVSAARAAAALEVSTTSSEGCTTEHRPGATRRLLVEPRPGLQCRLDVRVTNRGSSPVRVDQLLGYQLGAESGRVVRAGRADGVTPRTEFLYDGIAATYRVDRVVGPGRTRTFTMRLEFEPAGCSYGGGLELEPWPGLKVTAFGRSERISSPNVLILGRSTGADVGEGCDS